MNRKNAGFTLIELMIVVAIVAILSAIAYPSYQDSVRKSRRADATSQLLETAQQMERCYTQNNAYNHADCPSGTINTDGGYYTVTITRAASTFSLTANPVAGTSQAADGKCATFTITQTGAKTATGTDSTNCWK